MVNWAAHYDKIYQALGVDVVLTIAETSEQFTLRAIDKTSGVVLDGPVGIGTVEPGCAIRTAELADHGIDYKTLRLSTIAINGATWRIEKWLEKPSPSGLGVGELVFIMSEAAP